MALFAFFRTPLVATTGGNNCKQQRIQVTVHASGFGCGV